MSIIRVRVRSVRITNENQAQFLSKELRHLNSFFFCCTCAVQLHFISSPPPPNPTLPHSMLFFSGAIHYLMLVNIAWGRGGAVGWPYIEKRQPDCQLLQIFQLKSNNRQLKREISQSFLFVKEAQLSLGMACKGLILGTFISQSKGHHFVSTHYTSLTFCNHCNGLLWGIGDQGYQCSSK